MLKYCMDNETNGFGVMCSLCTKVAQMEACATINAGAKEPMNKYL